MTLDREAARALFANADSMPSTDASPFARPASLFGEAGPASASTAAMPASGAHRATNSRIDEPTPFAAAPPFATPQAAHSAPPSPHTHKGGVDWRLVAPLGVAAVCAGAIALFALPRDSAEEGRTVAASDIAAPPAATPLPVAPPIEPIDSAAMAPVATPVQEPVVQRAAATRPAARRAPDRQVAESAAPAAPSATDPASSSYASVTAPAVAAPTLGAPPPVVLSPTTPGPAETTPPTAEPQ